MAKRQFKPVAKVEDKEVDSFISGGAQVTQSAPVRGVGRPVERTEPTKTFNCNLPESLFRKLKLDSVERDTTMTEIIIDMLKQRYN
jgi:hypothetical protein